MDQSIKLNLPATREALQEGLTKLEDYCTARNVPREMVVRLLVVVEELFTNTIKYGYRGECDRPVRLVLRAAPQTLELAYEDEAPTFDPTRWNASPVLDAKPDRRPVGRTGIPLVMGMVASARYEPQAPGNRLVLHLAPDPASDARAPPSAT